MTPERLRKCWTLFFVLLCLSVVVGLMLYALSENISLFYTPTELKKVTLQSNQHIRVGGMVEKGSVERVGDLTIQFKITDFERSLPIVYTGILPDLFKEGSGAVVQGVLVDNVFQADQVLAKHDENYMPPQVRSALAKQGVP